MITLDNRTSAAIEEGARLYLLNQRPNAVEVAFRMRALQEISQALPTDGLLSLVQICSEAERVGMLRTMIEQYIASQEAPADAQRSAGQPGR